MPPPFISVLMPAYNHEGFVRLAVESVLTQTHADLELIVIDDASTDGTWEVLQSCRDERMRCQRHDVNRGAHASLNEALAQARGEYVAILNSDDVYRPGRLERLLAESRADGAGHGLIFSDLGFIDPAGLSIPDHPRARDFADLSERCQTLDPAHWFFAGNPAVTTSNFFFRRELADRVGGFAALRYTHDWDWALRTTRYAPPVWVREPLLEYRVHPANTLSEIDTWRHVHENSYVQAKALLALASDPKADDPGVPGEEVIRALLGNESLHPVSLIAFLTTQLAGGADSALATDRDGEWFLRRIAGIAGLPETVFAAMPKLVESENIIAAQAAMIDQRGLSIETMSAEITHREEAIAAQAAMIEERWQIIQSMSEEIANRDKCIAGQAVLIDERGAAIAEMGQEIFARDQRVGELEAAAESVQGELATLRSELTALHRRFLVRATLLADKLLGRNA
jgi:Glycosyl transferase family 2